MFTINRVFSRLADYINVPFLPSPLQGEGSVRVCGLPSCASPHPGLLPQGEKELNKQRFTFGLNVPLLVLLFACFGETCLGSDYHRIVSLAPSVTKNVRLLGMSDRLVGTTLYCPPGAPHAVSVGTVLEPSIETIVTLKPDLVIATKEGNASVTVERLRSLGIRVYAMDPCDNFDDINRGFLALANVVGKEDMARSIVSDAKARVNKVRAKTANRKRTRVFWEMGAQPLFTASRKSYLNYFMEYAGGENIFSECAARYPQISREEVLRRDPDAIILITMGDVTPKEKEYWESFPSLKAVAAKKVFILSGPLFTDPTPAGFAEGVERIAALLHQ